MGAGGLMIVGCLLPWVSYTTAFGGSLDRNAFQLGQDLGFSAQGLVGVFLGLVTVLLGLCRLNRTRMPAWLAHSPLWPGLGAGIFLALAFPIAKSSTGVFASYGVGIWVFGVGVACALGSALILRRTRARRLDIGVQAPDGLGAGSPGVAAPDSTRIVSRQTPAAATDQTAKTRPAGASVSDDIRKLSELRDAGILTEAEFQAKKTELLSRM